MSGFERPGIFETGYMDSGMATMLLRYDLWQQDIVAGNGTSGTNQKEDAGLNGMKGQFTAIEWTEKEKLENPNRRGFVRATENGHALQYADGSPFFMVGDTWLAGTTWRLPFRNAPTSDNYTPGRELALKMPFITAKDKGLIQSA